MSELGLVTDKGKVVWGNKISSNFTYKDDIFFALLLIVFPVLTPAGKYAQVTNNPENDGCINAVLLV